MRQRTLRGWNSSFNSRFPLDVKSVLMTASNQNRLRKYLRTRGSIVSSLTNMNWAAKSTSVRMHLNIENNTTHLQDRLCGRKISGNVAFSNLVRVTRVILHRCLQHTFNAAAEFFRCDSKVLQTINLVWILQVIEQVLMYYMCNM